MLRLISARLDRSSGLLFIRPRKRAQHFCKLFVKRFYECSYFGQKHACRGIDSPDSEWLGFHPLDLDLDEAARTHVIGHIPPGNKTCNRHLPGNPDGLLDSHLHEANFPTCDAGCCVRMQQGFFRHSSSRRSMRRRPRPWFAPIQQWAWPRRPATSCRFVRIFGGQQTLWRHCVVLKRRGSWSAARLPHTGSNSAVRPCDNDVQLAGLACGARRKRYHRAGPLNVRMVQPWCDEGYGSTTQMLRPDGRERSNDVRRFRQQFRGSWRPQGASR
ncbi:hypothetical protein GFPCMMHI_06222 [Ensifer adhaerens]|nr:hypothetical protein [Ensifer adhaerens]